MLTLPDNFKKDIQGRDTALIPLVVIGNLDSYSPETGAAWANDSIHISTNIVSKSGALSSGGGNPYSFNTKPIL